MAERITLEKHLEIKELAKKHSVVDVAAMLGVGRTAVYEHLKMKHYTTTVRHPQHRADRNHENESARNSGIPDCWV